MEMLSKTKKLKRKKKLSNFGQNNNKLNLNKQFKYIQPKIFKKFHNILLQKIFHKLDQKCKNIC